MKVLIVDNYDSFTYNLYHYVKKCGVEVSVKRNDELNILEINEFDKIILSPGPGLPSETPLMYEIIEKYHTSKPILGVCLGMQGIAEFFGGKLMNQKEVKHGVQTIVTVDTNTFLYKNLPQKIEVGLYHSWCVDDYLLPKELIVTGKSQENIVMSLEHKTFPIYGVQYHPESIMTTFGGEIIVNFLKTSSN